MMPSTDFTAAARASLGAIWSAKARLSCTPTALSTWPHSGIWGRTTATLRLAATAGNQGFAVAFASHAELRHGWPPCGMILLDCTSRLLNQVGVMAAGQPWAILSISTALSGPLLDLIGAEGGGIHFGSSGNRVGDFG